MNSKLVQALIGFLLFASLTMARPDEFSEYGESQYDETRTVEKDETRTVEKDETQTVEKEETSNDEGMEDMNTETSTALVENDDPDHIKHKGFCHFGIAAWFKPGVSVRCSCLKCTCKTGGNWACAFEFSFCPYYYCGNQVYNPKTQICCCGKVHNKTANYSCCGYFYYDTRYSQCCNYYSVKSKKAKCPRHKI